jgi:phosphoinositide-3-kinase regulatory subunit 4
VDSHEVAVRIAFAENLASLAETALRFLDLSQFYTDDELSLYSGLHLQYQGSYQSELENLHNVFEKKVVTLLCDQENIVKRTLLENGIAKLCVFFGRRKANDILLSHLITFQNDKSDWQLRGAFFDSVISLVAYVGWHTLSMIMPLLQLGLTDVEEFVVMKAVNALTALCELGLFRNSTVVECLNEILPLLYHPNIWIRYAAVGFVMAVSKFFCVADVHCVLLDKLQPYLKHPIIQPDNSVVVLDALREPISRQVFDYLVKQPLLPPTFQRLKEMHESDATVDLAVDDPLCQVFNKLQSFGVTREDEDKLLVMREYFCRIHNVKLGATDRTADSQQQSGHIDLTNMREMCHVVDLKRATDMKPEMPQMPQSKRSSGRRQTEPVIPPTDDWSEMFGKSKGTKQLSSRDLKQAASGRDVKTKTMTTQSDPGTKLQQGDNTSTSKLGSSERSSTPVRGMTAKRLSPTPPKIEGRAPQCKLDFHKLITMKKDSYASDLRHFQQLSSSLAKSRPIEGNGWTPKGILVAHHNEHKSYINRISVMDDASFFGTCSDDGTVKLWNTQKFEKVTSGKQRVTYNRQGGKIKALTFCMASSSFASASDNGSVALVSLNRLEETNTIKVKGHSRVSLNIQDTSNSVIDMDYFDTGKANILACATVYGELIGYDLRTQSVAWQLQNNLKHGLITSFVVSPSQCWLSLGTSTGTHVCWDMRFQLPITTWKHPGGHYIRRVVACPHLDSCILSSCHGSNEVDLWSMESGLRNKVFWASRSPPLSQRQDASSRALHVNGMCCGWSDHGPYVLLGGTDRRLRLWDLTTPSNSYLVCKSGSDAEETTVQYKSKVVDGYEALIESDQTKSQEEGGDERERALLKSPMIGHMDSITDVALAQGEMNYVITTSANGVMKIWK